MARNKNTPLDGHNKYPMLQKFFACNWVLAAQVLFGITTLSSQQKDFLNNVKIDGSRVTVSSGHGTGKSYLQGLIILLFIILHPNSQVVVLSNTVKQTRRGVWKNLGIHYNNLRKYAPWIANHFVLTDTMFYAKSNKQGWNVEVKAIQQGNYENLAGEHNDHFLCIVDEASGVPDDAFGVLLGALSQGDNRMILISQPTRHSGFFYRTHHELRQTSRNPEGWVAMVMSSIDSPHVTAKFIRDRAAEYGGIDAVHFKIKVLGQFPDKIDGYLLGRNQLQGCVGKDLDMGDHWGWVAACDVGFGRDKSVVSIFKVSGEIGRTRLVRQVKTYEMPNDMLSHEFGSKIVELCVDSGDYPNVTIVVDAYGGGRDVVGAIEQKRPNANVVGLKWGVKPFRKIEQEMYVNLRAKSHMMVQDAVIKGRISISQGVHTEKTIEQGSKLPYFMNDHGQYQIMKKIEMSSKHNIPSPDIFDTYCFAQLVDYIPANDHEPDDMDEEDWNNWEDAA